MLRTSCKIIVLAILLTTVFGCERLGRPKFTMPGFNFITTENLHSIAMAGERNIWMSGSHGTILFSSDGGKTWTRQESGMDDLLLGCIAFANTKQGWAAGVGGTIIHTTDGGNTWSAQKSGTENDIHDLFILNEKMGWAVGAFGTIQHTSDGGRKWVQQREPEDVFFNDVFFTDPSTGWVVGEFGTILHTSDGGNTWQLQECPELADDSEDLDWERPLPALYGICFLDSRRGWVVGLDGVIIRTDDGGKTWKKLQSGTDKPLYSISIKGGRGWIVGNKGVYLFSQDGGATWTEKADALKTKFWLREVAFSDESHGLLVGARGTIALSADGGTSWDLISGYRYDMEEFGLADF